MLAFVCAALLWADAGVVRVSDAKKIFDAVFAEQRAADAAKRIELMSQTRLARDRATGEERQMLERLLRFIESNDAIEKHWPEWVELNRDLIKLSRGDWQAERASVGAFQSLAAMARNYGLDPAPLKAEAAQHARDLLKRWPEQGRAHGLVASTMLEQGAELTVVLPELKKCVQLDATADWCKTLHTSLVAGAEAPRCSGKQLKQTLTIGGEGEKPFLGNEDYEKLTLDEMGSLNVQVSAAAAKRLEQETERRVGKVVVFKLGDEVLMSPHVNEKITGGSVRVTPGKGKQFTLEALCKSVDKPMLPAALKLP